MNELPDPNFIELDRAAKPPGHPSVCFGRVGVLLMNLGTPDGTGYWPVRRYLKEFLSDERVIEEPKWKWWPILNFIILTVRPGRKGKDYAAIWNSERDRVRSRPLHAVRPNGWPNGFATIRISSSIGRCATPTRQPKARFGRSKNEVAIAFCWLRSILSTQRRLPPRPAIRPFAR